LQDAVPTFQLHKYHELAGVTVPDMPAQNVLAVNPQQMCRAASRTRGRVPGSVGQQKPLDCRNPRDQKTDRGSSWLHWEALYRPNGSAVGSVVLELSPVGVTSSVDFRRPPSLDSPGTWLRSTRATFLQHEEETWALPCRSNLSGLGKRCSPDMLRLNHAYCTSVLSGFQITWDLEARTLQKIGGPFKCWSCGSECYNCGSLIFQNLIKYIFLRCPPSHSRRAQNRYHTGSAIARP